MTGMLLTMLRARMGLTLATFGLTTLAVAAAVIGPLYAAAAARSVVDVEFGAAPVAERVITGERVDDPLQAPPGHEPQEAHPVMAGFETVRGVMTRGELTTGSGVSSAWLTARSGFCAHVVVASGRCPSADREVMVREDADVPPGTKVRFAAFSFGGGPPRARIEATVVGVYKAYAATDPFWADRVMLVGPEDIPMFTTERTVTAAASAGGTSLMKTTDLIASPEVFTDRQALSGRVAETLRVLDAAGYDPASDIDALSKRIGAAGETLRTSFVFATLPLVVICWYVLLLAVAGAVRQRRGELAVTGLHGVPGRTRWWLEAGQMLVPMAVGVVPGLLLGYAVAAILAGVMLPGRPAVTLSLGAVGLAAAAVLGATAVGIAAQWSALRTPVLRLLRGAVPRHRSPAFRIAEIAAGVLAVAAGYQAASGIEGIGVLAPVAFGLGCGLLAGRLLLAPAGRLGRRLLRRGRLAGGLAALALARRPGSRAMVALLAVGFGMLGFSLTAVDTAERAWHERAALETGAAQVVSIAPLPPSRLLEATRAADPQGTFAMAVVRMQQPQSAPVLAVDATRLAAVANWPASGMSAAETAGLLRPVEIKPVFVRAAALRVTVTLHELAPQAVARMEVSMLRPDGTRTAALSEPLRPGTGLYTLDTPECAAKPCRLINLAVGLAPLGGHRLEATISDISRDSGGDGSAGSGTGSDRQPILDRAALADLDRWRQAEPTPARPVAQLRSTAEGMRLIADSPLAVDTRVRPASAAEPLPALATGEVPDRFSAIGGSVAVVRAGSVALLPRLGRDGILVDLENLDLALNPRAETVTSQIWLSGGAPANAVELLQRSGVTVESVTATAAQHTLLRRQAPALALHFQRLAALAAMLLAAIGLLVAALLERTRREDDLSILVSQGLPARTVHMGALLARCAVVGAAGLAGLAAALATWLAARPVIPASAATIPPPPWPGPGIGPILLGALVFTLFTGWTAARMAHREGAAT